jgi:GntP family gluconate:H+ symporter
MFGLATDTFLLLDAMVTIIGLILLITHFKVHPFVALTLAAGFLGLTSGMPVAKVMKSFQDGFGGVLGFVGIVLALGTMLGKLMADSGGADQIAQTLIRAFGKQKVHWAMMFAAFLVGIPLFFEIGFVLLIPLVFIVARRSGVSLVKIGIPLLAGLSVVHGLVPPHPGHCWRSASSTPTSARPSSTACWSPCPPPSSPARCSVTSSRATSPATLPGADGPDRP